jgi:hypothetical protein
MKIAFIIEKNSDNHTKKRVFGAKNRKNHK